MKRKLKIVFILIAFALLGIIIFQTYWTANAYLVNKERFDGNITIAMQKAMDDCKRDYLDSIRRVMVRRLSPPETIIKVDTLPQIDKMSFTNNITNMHIEDYAPPHDLKIWFSNKYIKLNKPYNVNSTTLDQYRANISHKASLPEILTGMSFEMHPLMEDLQLLFGTYDIQEHAVQSAGFYKKHPHISLDSIRKFNISNENSIYDLPQNYRAADSVKLYKYFKSELEKLHIRSGFNLVFSDRRLPEQKLNFHHSQTIVLNYDYHGFVYFYMSRVKLFFYADFRNPQHTILKSMLLPLLLSALLMLFMVFCFIYIIRTFIVQKKLSELKDDFINNMTHELKTPIATMSVAIEGLEKFNALHDADKTQRYLQTSKNELQRLNQLVTKVLDIAAFENKEIQLNKELVAVDELAAEVIESEKLKSAKLVDITYINKDKVKVIDADKTHFKNVLANILDNAVKYSTEPVAIVISCYKSDKYVNFSIKDNGPGIPPDQVKLIFDKFHRVPTGNIHTVKGTGLGLSYVRYIVKAHNGDIAVKSEINKGSEFIVSIPLSNG
jgi:signal transduction histidine kinase